ncbi:MAG: LPXTG cell wall anchor domain-containing protein [Ilumatobacteraceae bacterium]
MLAADGSWIPDPSDAILRDGLTIQVEVNPTATATVSYPPATSACNGPEDAECVPGEDNDGETGSDSCNPCTPGDDGDDTPEDDCTPCYPGDNNDDNPADDCTPCYPGQNNDDNPADDCTLPKTGGGPGTMIYIGGAALLAGLLFVAASRRRNTTPTAP